MSSISSYDSTPISLFGVNGGNTSNDISISTLVGNRFQTTDYREVTLVQVGASAIASGVLVQGPASIGANHTDLATVGSPAIGANQITVTLGGTLVTANQYAGGFAVVSAGTGIGQTLKISSHPGQTSTTGNVVLTLEDPLSVALVGGTTTVSLVLNPYGSLNGTNFATSGVVISPTTATGQTVGVSLYPLPASTATVASYGFVVNKGAVACLCGATAAIGLDLMPSSATAGAVIPYVVATRNRIGTATVAGQSTKAELINIQL